jgi:hypothetical protein
VTWFTLGIWNIFPRNKRGKRRKKLRKLFAVLFVLLLSTSLVAQVRTGNIYGKVVDEDGNALPGVTLTLSGSLTAPMTSLSKPSWKALKLKFGKTLLLVSVLMLT